MRQLLFPVAVALGVALAAPPAPAVAQPMMGQTGQMGHGFPPGGFGGRPTFMSKLPLPRLIMRHQSEIGLTDEQRDTISKLVADTQGKVVDLRFQSEAQSQKLGELLDPHPVNEADALAQADKLMDLEKEMKRAHLAMLIEVGNTLTAEQRAKLRELQPQRPHGRPRARRPPGPPGAAPPPGPAPSGPADGPAAGHPPPP
jgi:Spy/CpxP family protein refolding chaperone